MVRAWVAFACGLKAVPGFWSSTSAATPRRPSSLASIRPQGPPPTIRTWVDSGSTPEILEREGCPRGLPTPASYRRSLGDQAIPRAIPTINRAHDEVETARSPLRAARRNYVTGACKNYRLRTAAWKEGG